MVVFTCRFTTGSVRTGFENEIVPLSISKRLLRKKTSPLVSKTRPSNTGFATVPCAVKLAEPAMLNWLLARLRFWDDWTATFNLMLLAMLEGSLTVSSPEKLARIAERSEPWLNASLSTTTRPESSELSVEPFHARSAFMIERTPLWRMRTEFACIARLKLEVLP